MDKRGYTYIYIYIYIYSNMYINSVSLDRASASAKLREERRRSVKARGRISLASLMDSDCRGDVKESESAQREVSKERKARRFALTSVRNFLGAVR
jgi:hypothetical protein